MTPTDRDALIEKATAMIDNIETFAVMLDQNMSARRVLRETLEGLISLASPSPAQTAMMAALAPFAEHADEYDGDRDGENPQLADDTHVWPTFTIGDFRQARAALASSSSPAQWPEDVFRERLQAIIDWADFAMTYAAMFDSHGVRNLDGPIFDKARAALATLPPPEDERVKVCRALASFLRERADWFKREYLNGGSYEHLSEREKECRWLAVQIENGRALASYRGGA